jgi:hypothetical protein
VIGLVVLARSPWLHQEGWILLLRWRAPVALKASPLFDWPGKFGQHRWIEEIGGV